MQIPFEENEEIIQLPCSHIFNKDGILLGYKMNIKMSCL